MKRRNFTKDFLEKKLYGNYLKNDSRSKVKRNSIIKRKVGVLYQKKDGKKERKKERKKG